MTHIFHIDASPRGERSISRTLAKQFISNWQTAHPNDTVTYRDIGHYPVPFVTEAGFGARQKAINHHRTGRFLP